MSEHIVHPRVYIAIFFALLVGTILTAWVAFFNFPGPLNAIVALTIACVKATLVVLFFMHVRYSSRLIWLVIASALFWLAIMFALTISDYSSRSWLPISTM
jgi:cytochrome c oxidase subunit 4